MLELEVITPADTIQYTELRAALIQTFWLGIVILRIIGDSEMIQQQMLEIFVVKFKLLRPLWESAVEVADPFNRVGFEHHLRAFNEIAHLMTTTRMDTSASVDSSMLPLDDDTVLLRRLDHHLHNNLNSQHSTLASLGFQSLVGTFATHWVQYNWDPICWGICSLLSSLAQMLDVSGYAALNKPWLNRVDSSDWDVSQHLKHEICITWTWSMLRPSCGLHRCTSHARTV